MDDKIRESVSSLIQYFLGLRAGNDCYSLRYDTLMLIYDITKTKFPAEKFNTSDLYNLQYNFEHFCVGGVNPNKVEMLDYQNQVMTPYDLERRLQEYLNKMFLCLSPIILTYGVMPNVPIR